MDSDGGASIPGPGKAAAASTAHAVWSEVRQVSAIKWPDQWAAAPECNLADLAQGDESATAAGLDLALSLTGDRVQVFVGGDAGSA